MYSLLFLFFALPLYFSHIFAPFGLIIWESSSFERQKMYLFVFLVILSLIENLILNKIQFLNACKKYGYYLLLFFVLPLLSGFFWSWELGNIFFVGSQEKHHGYIWYSAFLMFFLSLMSLRWEAKKKLIRATMISAIIVALCGIIEYISGASLFFPRSLSASWWDSRAISTLGNPNYLAGFLLMCLPLFTFFRSPERWIYLICIVFGIFVTGSYIGIFLVGVYWLYVVLQRYLDGKKSIIFWSLITLFVLGLCYFSFPYDKFLSLESRFVLMRELWTVMVWYPLSFVIWFWPESIIQYFNLSRSDAINAYFPSGSAIDSSHNIILDFIFQYGILLLWVIVYGIRKISFLWSSSVLQGALLWVLFLSLNVTITAHLILIMLFISRGLDENKS